MTGTPVTDGAIDTSELLELAMEASPSGILVASRDGTIALVNRQLERQFGYSRAELVGRAVEMLLPEPLAGDHVASRTAFLSEPEARAMGAGRELFGRRRDGSQFPVEIALTPVVADGHSYVIAVVSDIAERRRRDQRQADVVDDQLGFERLVTNLSVEFIDVPAEAVERAVVEALARVAETAGVDGCSLYRIGSDATLRPAETWQAPGVPALNVTRTLQELFPWTAEQIRTGEPASFSTPAEIPHPVDRSNFEALGVRSAAFVPLFVDGRIAGALSFHTLRTERTWSATVMARLTMVASIFAQVLARERRDDALRKALAEVERLRDDLQAENQRLLETRERKRPAHIVGRSAALQRVIEQVHQVAATDSTVLLLGETGVGKELFASQIHELSARRLRPMVRVNCAAIPSTLIESELFGREKGAFTGSLSRQIGRFEVANHSTIFLDEIGDLPLDVQVKLLRVLEERRIERLGSPQPIAVDTRIIAATHRNLPQRIAERAFREDLFYRLNVFPIEVPPLRDRLEDVPLLVAGFVEEFSKAFGRQIESVTKDSLAALQRYAWPGNIRELRNVVERAMIVSTGPQLTIAMSEGSTLPARHSARLVDVEREHIRRVLESTGWRVRGVGGAAERLGLKPTTLETLMARIGIRRADRP